MSAIKAKILKWLFGLLISRGKERVESYFDERLNINPEKAPEPPTKKELYSKTLESVLELEHSGDFASVDSYLDQLHDRVRSKTGGVLPESISADGID